jgi:hypothetical protein
MAKTIAMAAAMSFFGAVLVSQAASFAETRPAGLLEARAAIPTGTEQLK